MKPAKCPAGEKKMRQEKRKTREGEKAKSRDQDCCVTLNPYPNFDQKAAKCTTRGRLCGKV